MPDESGLCNGCLSREWSELQRRANRWDVNGLRATVDERPLPTPPRRRSRPGATRDLVTGGG